jgi:Cu+-exporting ATPase
MLAASLDRHSEHPFAAAIVSEHDRRGGKYADIEDFESITGKGVQGVIDGRHVSVGSGKTEKFDISTAPMMSDDAAEDMTRYVIATVPNSLVGVAVDGVLIGQIGIIDEIKGSAKSVAHQLSANGVDLVMMTGDNAFTAKFVAGEVGIARFFSDVQPEEKAAKVKELQSQGKIVAMAGDGVNDAPALAQADVGIAFASGTDVAIESADITLLRPDLDGILRAINLSRATMRNIRQNLLFAFAYNIIGVPIAAGVLFPFTGLLLSPMIASAAMMFSSVSVILNALRLRNAKI